MLHTIDAFEGHSVRIFTLKPRRLECTVKIHKDMPVAGFRGYLLVKIDHILILHLHKIHLYAGYAPFLIHVKYLFHSFLSERGPQCPKHHVHALRLGIRDDFLKVQIFLRLHDIESGFAPPLVHKDIRKAVSGGEIHVVFIRIGVHTCLEIDSVHVKSRPPFPAYLARLEPGVVSGNLLRGQLPRQGVLNQIAVSANGENSPRERARALGSRYDICQSRNGDVPVRAHNIFVYDVREFGRQGLLSAASQEKIRIIEKISFSNHNTGAQRGLEAQWQIRIRVRTYLAQRHLLEIGLAMRDIVRILLPYPIDFVIGDEIPLAHFVLYLHTAVEKSLETIGDAVVVSAEDHGPVLAETQSKFVILVCYLPVFCRDKIRQNIVLAVSERLRAQIAFAQNGSVRKRHTYLAVLQNLLAFIFDAPVNSGRHAHLRLDIPRWRR